MHATQALAITFSNDPVKVKAALIDALYGEHSDHIVDAYIHGNGYLMISCFLAPVAENLLQLAEDTINGGDSI